MESMLLNIHHFTLLSIAWTIKFVYLVSLMDPRRTSS